MKIRLEYSTDWQKWTLVIIDDTQRVTFPAEATVPSEGRYLAPDTPPIEVELPMQISIDLSFDRLMGAPRDVPPSAIRPGLAPIRWEETP